MKVLTDGQRWGRWRFDAALLTLTCEDCYGNGYGYEMDLEECTSSAKVLDWIFQITRKMWCTKEDAGDLLEALQDLLDPQATLCSCGVNNTCDATAYLRQKIETHTEAPQ